LLLVLNIGSSTIKFGVFAAEDGARLAGGAVEQIGLAPRLVAILPGGERCDMPAPDGLTPALTRWLLAQLEARFGGRAPLAAGHRVVHGGLAFAEPTRVTPAVLATLETFSPLAPAHQPLNLDGISAVAERWPGAPQVACFDTAFHQTRPRLAMQYALPRALTDEGILRYGFHGLSYAHIAGVLPGVIGADRAAGRVLVAHLGSGASLCAMRGGQSVQTTLGFGTLDGLVMGTRCGQSDPGVIFHLMRTRGMDAGQVEALLSQQSGLLGVSGLSPDMRILLASPDREAAEAVALFVLSVVHHAGALIAEMGGIDALVFTAGIGERSPAIRAQVMRALGWLGLDPDPEANEAGETILSSPDSRVLAAMIPTDEEGVILQALRSAITASDFVR